MDPSKEDNLSIDEGLLLKIHGFPLDSPDLIATNLETVDSDHEQGHQRECLLLTFRDV